MKILSTSMTRQVSIGKTMNFFSDTSEISIVLLHNTGGLAAQLQETSLVANAWAESYPFPKIVTLPALAFLETSVH